jgi:hypothetical protein
VYRLFDPDAFYIMPPRLTSSVKKMEIHRKCVY